MTNVMFVEFKLSPAGPHLLAAWITTFFRFSCSFFGVCVCVLLFVGFVWLFSPDWPTCRQTGNCIFVTSIFAPVCLHVLSLRPLVQTQCLILYLCMCVCLWRGYLCSDKTVNQINLAWKSLSAGPLCTMHVCMGASQTAHQVRHWF